MSLKNQLPVDHVPNRSEAGFSMLETIAALAILSMALVPLLSLQSQLASGSARLERQAELVRATDVAETYLSLVNPSLTPEGVLDLGGNWQVSWQSEPMGPPERARFGIGLSSRYLSQPFRLEARLIHASGREFDMERMVLGIQESAPFASESGD